MGKKFQLCCPDTMVRLIIMFMLEFLLLMRRTQRRESIDNIMLFLRVSIDNFQSLYKNDTFQGKLTFTFKYLNFYMQLKGRLCVKHSHFCNPDVICSIEKVKYWKRKYRKNRREILHLIEIYTNN